MIKLSKVIRRSDGWYVISHTTGRNLGGPYSSREQADKRLAQVRAFKYMKKAEYVFDKYAKKSHFKVLKENRTPLTDEERAECLKRRAVWHNHPNPKIKEVPAVWKSKNPYTGKISYITNTHRAYAEKPTLSSAIERYHNFIKGTA